MTKTHFARFANASTNPNAAPYAQHAAVCGRDAKSTRVTTETSRVSCISCRKDVRFIEKALAQKAAREAAYAAQEPRQVANPWNYQAIINCIDCGHDLFREYGRSLDYYNYDCANCGKRNHVITETGMSA